MRYSKTDLTHWFFAHRPRRSIRMFLLGGACVLGQVAPVRAQNASADSASMIPPPVQVSPPLNGMACDIVAEDGQRTFELRTGDNFASTIARCAGHCQLTLPRGVYRWYAPATGTKPAQSIDFVITAPSLISVGDTNPERAKVGRVLGIAGIPLLAVGVLLLGSAICIDECPDSTARQTRALLGLAGIAAGAVMVPVGWWLYRNGNEVPVRVKQSPTVGVGIVHTHKAAQLALTWSF